MSPLSSEARRAIVTLLRNGDRSAGEIAEALGRPRPGVSHHLSRLLDCGLVRCRQDGAHRYYSLDPNRVLAAWDEYVGDELGTLAAMAEPP
jgi:DNA-binding transcriptional ArsR family regulator